MGVFIVLVSVVHKNDLKTISEDYIDTNEPTENDKNAPALENISFIPFSGAKVTMKSIIAKSNLISF